MKKKKIKTKTKKAKAKKKDFPWIVMIFFLSFGFLLGALTAIGSELDIRVADYANTVGLYSNDFCGYGNEWIHVRVDENSNYERLVELCNHEAGHELFCRLTNKSHDCWSEVGEHYAEVCEKYPNLCLNDEFVMNYSRIDTSASNGDESFVILNVKMNNVTWYEGDLTISGMQLDVPFNNSELNLTCKWNLNKYFCD